MNMLARFLSETLWRIDVKTRPWWQRLALRPLQFAILTARTYLRDGSLLHAAALTYITMLAIVPVLTLGLTSLKAFGAGDLAERKLMENIDYFVGEIQRPTMQGGEASAESPASAAAAQPDAPASENAEPAHSAQEEKAEAAAQTATALRQVFQTLFDQINSINFAKIGIVGAVTLIIMVVTILGKIETSFNALWGVAKARPIWRKFTDYLSVIIIVPLLVLSATTLPVLESVTRAMPDLWGLRHFLEGLGIFNRLVPILGGTLLFAFLFAFLPNVKVRLSSSFLGAFITTIVLIVFFKLCMFLQVGIGSNSKLYGSLVALPILLFWIYSSWEIILLGAEICYVHQHRAELLRESAFTHPSVRDRIVTALALVLGAARCVEEEYRALSTQAFADKHLLPTRDVAFVAAILERNHILLPIQENGSTIPAGFVLGRCATKLKISDVINACLDDAEGEAVLRRAVAVEHGRAIAEIDRQFSDILAKKFDLTIARALELAKEHGQNV